MENNKKKSIIPTIILTILSLLWIYPIILILLNSLKKESAITTTGVFELPLGEIWNGFTNYVASVTQMDFLKSFWYSLVISVMSVVLILLCCSMCAWYIVRVNGVLSKILYYLFIFSMVVPFQMVMFTLAKTADTLKLNTPYNICIIYLGFGAGLSLFMFCGFIKAIPISLEEAATIDGANFVQRLFKVVLPLMKPAIATVCIINFITCLNNFFTPLYYSNNIQVLSVAIVQLPLRDNMYGVPWDLVSAMGWIILLPIIIFVAVFEKQIMDGIMAGGVKA